jgi:hypothetical protein
MPAPLVVGAAAAAAKLLARKLAKDVAKKSAAKANARGLKAANKDVAIKYKKGLNNKNFSGRNETKPKQVSKDKVRRPGNQDAPMTRPSSYKQASVKSRFILKDKNSIVLKEAKPAVKVKPAAKTKGNPPNLVRAKDRQIESVARAGGVKGPLGKARDRRVFTSKNPTANLKPMEDVPAGVSARFAETNARLAKETLRKKAVPAVRKTISGRVINERAKKAQMPKKSK